MTHLYFRDDIKRSQERNRLNNYTNINSTITRLPTSLKEWDGIYNYTNTQPFKDIKEQDGLNARANKLIKDLNEQNALNAHHKTDPTLGIKERIGQNKHTNTYYKTNSTEKNLEEQRREQSVEEEPELDLEEIESDVESDAEPVESGLRNVGGRPKKYATVEEAAIVKRKQTKESHRRIHRNLAEIKARQSTQQQQRVRYLQRNVIKDTGLLDAIYNRLQEDTPDA
jgi:hypothetical protein